MLERKMRLGLAMLGWLLMLSMDPVAAQALPDRNEAMRRAEAAAEAQRERLQRRTEEKRLGSSAERFYGDPAALSAEERAARDQHLQDMHRNSQRERGDLLEEKRRRLGAAAAYEGVAGAGEAPSSFGTDWRRTMEAEQEKIRMRMKPNVE